MFFDACDGIFLNYWWSVPGSLNDFVSAAGPKRQNDVYVGVDVFGRGTYEGGGYKSNAVCLAF